jgi:hypothetical protein
VCHPPVPAVRRAHARHAHAGQAPPRRALRQAEGAAALPHAPRAPRRVRVRGGRVPEPAAHVLRVQGLRQARQP